MFKGNCFNIEYTRKFLFVKVSKNDLFAIFFVAVCVGFFAFIYETLVDYVAVGYLFDRGFLIGPFIPIYFFCVLFGLMFIKTPKASIKNFFIYMLIIGAGISLVEFIVGNVCELLFHQVLWTYDGFMPLSYKYVSLSVAFVWGILGTALVMFVIPLIRSIPDKFSNKNKLIFAIVFFILFLSDVIATLIITCKNDWQYKELYCFKASIELSLFMIGCVLYIILAFFLGKFLLKSFKKIKPYFIAVYTLSVIIPVFSCIDFFDRFQNKFFSVLASLGFIILAIYIYLILSLLVLHLIRLIVKIFVKKEIIDSQITFSSIIYTSLVVSILVTLIGVGSVLNPKVTKLEVGEGDKQLNIVALSDIHYGSTGTNIDLEKMVERVNALNPDVVLLLGDIIDNKIENLDVDYFKENMAKINATYGVIATSGNHEFEYENYSKVFKFFAETNINLLIDEYVTIIDEIIVVGRLDSIFTKRQELNELIPEDNDLPVIVLDHQPQSYQESIENNVSLQLSGHTHNGQLFPANFIVKIYYSLMYKTSIINGLYKEDDFTLYISKGYGTWGFPLRTTGSSEIVQITYKY